MAQRTDVVLVGAGVVGASVAHELARRGRQVVVVDKGPGAGTGSTSASSAIVRFNYSTRTGVAAAWESKHLWEDWEGFLGGTDGGDGDEEFDADLHVVELAEVGHLDDADEQETGEELDPGTPDDERQRGRDHPGGDPATDEGGEAEEVGDEDDVLEQGHVFQAIRTGRGLPRWSHAATR